MENFLLVIMYIIAQIAMMEDFLGCRCNLFKGALDYLWVYTSLAYWLCNH